MDRREDVPGERPDQSVQERVFDHDLRDSVGASRLRLDRVRGTRPKTHDFSHGKSIFAGAAGAPVCTLTR
jgi:hypothetical protein